MGIERLYADGIEQAYQRGMRTPAAPVDQDFRTGSFLAAGFGGLATGLLEQGASFMEGVAGFQRYSDQRRAEMGARAPDSERKAEVQRSMDAAGRAARMRAQESAPDPQTAHMADQVFHGLTRFGAKAVGSVVAAGPVGGAALLGGEETNTIYRDLTMRGIDSETALKVAAVQGAISAAGVLLPISGAGMAATRAGKVAATAGLVAVGGPGAYVAQETLARDILQRAGYADEAGKHDPTNLLGLGISTILPGAFGAVALRGALRTVKPIPPIRTESGMRTAAQFTPEEQAASAEFERSAGNLAELRKEIARQKDPALRQVLEAELATQTQAAAKAGQGVVAEAAPMPAVYSKYLPPPADGMVRLYRAESPTVRFGDVFDATQLGQFKRPAGMTGDRYTDEFKLADYYRASYGRDAVIRFVDVPKRSLQGRGGAAGEFFVDTAVSVDRQRTAQAAAMSPDIVDAARVKVLQETVQRSLPEGPDAMLHLHAAMDAVAAGDRVDVPDFARPVPNLAQFIESGRWKAGEEPKQYPAYEGPDGFLGWVRSQGGIALAEKYDITGETNVVRSNPNGIFRGTGLGRDELARRAADAGYMLPDEAGDSSRFVDLLQGALMRGERVLTLEQQTEAAAWGASNRGMDDRIADLEARLRLLGEDPAAARGNPEAMEAYLAANEGRLLAAVADDVAARRGDDSPEIEALQDRARQIAQDIRDTDRTLAQFEAELQPLSPVMRRLVQEQMDAPKIEMKGDFLSALVPGGQVGGTIKPDGLHITFAELDEASRGQGTGVSMYSALIDEAHARGLRVFSDSTVEMPAVRVYEALERRGYELRRTPGGGELPPSEEVPAGALFGRGAREPVFEVLPRNPDAPNTTQAANPEAAAPARGAGDDAPPGAADTGRPATDVQAAGVARTVADQERQIVEALAAERPDMMVTLPGSNEAVSLADAVEMIRVQQALDESDADLVRAAVLCDLSP